MSSLTSTMNSDSICCSEHQNVKKKNKVTAMVCTVLHAQSSKIAFYKISLIKQFSISLRLSKQTLETNVDAMRTERY